MTNSINTQSKKLAKYWQIYLNLTCIYTPTISVHIEMRFGELSTMSSSRMRVTIMGVTSIIITLKKLILIMD